MMLDVRGKKEEGRGKKILMYDVRGKMLFLSSETLTSYIPHELQLLAQASSHSARFSSLLNCY